MIHGAKWTPAYTGEEGLFRLLKKAHSLYSEEVITHRKSYHRFAQDFSNSTRYHDNTDAWSKNEHRKNHCIVTELLLNQEEIVRKFFDCESTDNPKFINLLNEFYICNLPHPPIQGDIAVKTLCRESIESNSETNIVIDKKAISLIVRLANEVNLFKEVLNADEITRGFETDDMKPLVSQNNARLVLVLDRLAANNIIPYNWQSLIERKRLLVSSTGKKFLNKHDLASTLNRIKDMPLSYENNALVSVVDKYIRLIKNREIK